MHSQENTSFDLDLGGTLGFNISNGDRVNIQCLQILEKTQLTECLLNPNSFIMDKSSILVKVPEL